MINEVEIWGVLSKDEVSSKLRQFNKKFGPPKTQKRMAIQILDADDKSLWTRIRVADGNAEIMQKVAGWDDSERKEISVEVVPSVETVWGHYLVLRNLLRGHRLQTTIIQHENFIFETNGFEIKLSHQFGKSDRYPFEVEAKIGETEIIDFARSLGLEPDLSKKGETFWTKWNKEVNLNAEGLSKEELKNIIKAYLK